MVELRFHGRGGQGTVLAAKILAEAVLKSGRGECLALPEFGVERRGAPVVAYARISEGPIRLRSRIYEPDGVVIVDPTMAEGREILRGLKPGGRILVNTEKAPGELALLWPGFPVWAVPARRIALAHGLGPAASPMVNTAICGAVAAVWGLADIAWLEAAVRDAVPAKPDENAAAAREAYEFCRRGAYAAS